MNVLELACGTGKVWKGKDARLPDGMKIILSDISQPMVIKARELLQTNPAFSFETIDIQDIPYENEAFDIVIANHMLYHVPDIQKALSEVRRVLKGGGKFYATTIGDNSLKELNDIYNQFESRAQFAYSKDISFTLENGGAMLNEFFTNVEKRLYIDALEVTDINALMDYIKSYNKIPEPIYDEFYTQIQNGFSGDGIFYIQKEQGIFICGK